VAAIGSLGKVLTHCLPLKLPWLELAGK
jgi:hypothetical protein